MDIGSYNDFRIFLPEPAEISRSRQLAAETNRRNRDFLERFHAADGDFLPITGTFVYAHPPDYVGNPTLNWKRLDWDRAFGKLKGQGIDTIIFQASLWSDLQEVYYKSSSFQGFRCWNVVEPMLRSARENGLAVFLGGYGSVSGWSEHLAEEEAHEEIKRHTACMKELLVFRDLFDGIYFSSETAFVGSRDRARESCLNHIYKECLGRMKDLAGNKRMLMSPASIFHDGRSDDFLDFWEGLLQDVPLDILAPQDSIGCGCCALGQQPIIWKGWQTIAARRGIPLWADVEIFQRRGYGGPTPFAPAESCRVRAQLANVAPFVSKCVCWEALSFPLEGSGGE